MSVPKIPTPKIPKMPKKQKLPKIFETKELPVSAAAQERLKRYLGLLSDKAGKKVSEATLIEALLTEEQFTTALAALQPRLDKLAELEKQRQSLGIYFNE